MAQANMLAYVRKLHVEPLLGKDVQVLAHMPCLGYLSLQAKTVPEESIIICSNAFQVLKQFDFSYKLSCLTFEPGAMPRLKKLRISYDSRGPGSEHEEVSPVAGVEHLESLEEVNVALYAKRGEGSRLESLCREFIQRHQRCESMNINVRYREDDD
ncbi:hypothetical protein PVAP13_3NG210301 [Panicum virgatum]|uniref:Disease resistance R13L4/SHOC-2-like LRR domain-containing protein n=1 Tax=Panicum virgatum TaxID=38727 RepID=A0A8T0UFE4_PANVG|nr:hypothetical protein PVAP13_3NG210301 [Panicum virgatum]